MIMCYTDAQKLEIARTLAAQFINQISRLGVAATLTPNDGPVPYVIDLKLKATE